MYNIIDNYNKNYKGRYFRINTTKYDTVYLLGEIDREDYIFISSTNGLVFSNIYTISDVINNIKNGDWYFCDIIKRRKEKIKKLLKNE